MQVIPKFLSLPEIHKIVSHYFNNFFERHVATLMTDYPSNTIAVIGSIGVNFREIIETQGANFGLTEFRFVAKPAQYLIDYHLKKG